MSTTKQKSEKAIIASAACSAREREAGFSIFFFFTCKGNAKAVGKSREKRERCKWELVERFRVRVFVLLFT